MARRGSHLVGMASCGGHVEVDLFDVEAAVLSQVRMSAEEAACVVVDLQHAVDRARAWEASQVDDDAVDPGDFRARLMENLDAQFQAVPSEAADLLSAYMDARVVGPGPWERHLAASAADRARVAAEHDAALDEAWKDVNVKGEVERLRREQVAAINERLFGESGGYIPGTGGADVSTDGSPTWRLDGKTLHFSIPVTRPEPFRLRDAVPEEDRQADRLRRIEETARLAAEDRERDWPAGRQSILASNAELIGWDWNGSIHVVMPRQHGRSALFAKLVARWRAQQDPEHPSPPIEETK